MSGCMGNFVLSSELICKSALSSSRSHQADVCSKVTWEEGGIRQMV